VFKNRVIRIFRPNKNEITRAWGKSLNEELRNSYFSPNIIRVTKSMRFIWTGYIAAARYGEIRNAYQILVGKPEGRGPLY
jgi:hypothetical protein